MRRVPVRVVIAL
uniref:Uncharacterized protein n=1 Tax=Anguilla anguilla TaxID=7936 RepID=A0A0E9U024_ANGAN